MLWKCERSHHITTLALGAPTPPNEINAGLLEEQQRHDPLSTMYVYGTHLQPFGYDWNDHSALSQQ